ncbi:CTD small phosphatase-like protein 2 [Melia azedarach]|uniref:CTD small phosphatase-like protein 2 n=1 Tax=Melia azedarach TaxID=155640 RepID=A0ACC1WXL6_MELAZ|nr:CTD small phosphatase-like protein 2 [Melia azedarach]
MPSVKMKTKSSTVSVKEKYGLHVCLKSSVISKHSCSRVRISQQTAEFDACSENCRGVSSGMGVSTPGFNCDEAIERQELADEENSQFQMQPSVFVDCTTIERMESTLTCSSNLETIFSPVIEPVEVFSEPNINYDAGSDNGPSVPTGLGTDDSDDNRSSYANVESNPFPDYKCAEPNMLFDVDEYMMLPFLEDTAKSGNTNDVKSHEVATMEPDNGSLYLAINQMKSFNQESEVKANSDQAEHFDPQLLIKYLPELSDASNFQPTPSAKETQRRKSVTLVLDLDETLVHSTLEHCDDADFTFTVFFNMKEHTVYVKQRPYLKIFLERVAEMFEVVIFTASQSIYAAQLLDILDPEGKLISRRVYRESCIFCDGSYTKDLTVLGVDLAKVAIIDNSPQVFRLQVDNGIPIKSWFNDPSDCSLIALLPFLEILADAEDVRPIIANRFGNKE